MGLPAPARAKRTILITAVPFAIAAALFLTFHFWPRVPPTALYKGRSFESWFYPWKTNFSDPVAGDNAQKALWALGTNAFPVLLDNLTRNRGSGRLYLKVYWSLPALVRSQLPLPVLDDDIKAWTWHLVANMPVFTTDEVEALTRCIPRMTNARLRHHGLVALRINYRFEPSFASVCTNLLSDTAPGVRLQAAMSLAELTKPSVAPEPRLFHILIDGLQNKNARAQFLGPNNPEQDRQRRAAILIALNSLKPNMTPQQKECLAEVIRRSSD
jgi:hypothetical protein